MKRTTLSILLFAAVALSACKKEPAPATEVRAENASEAMRNDNAAIAERLAQQKAGVEAANDQQRAQTEKQQFVDSLSAVAKRWIEAVNEALRTGRSDMDPVIKKLEAVKAEADALAVNDCTGPARAALQTSMATTIGAYNQFRKETGAGTDASKQALQLGSTQFSDFEKMAAACR